MSPSAGRGTALWCTVLWKHGQHFCLCSFREGSIYLQKPFIPLSMCMFSISMFSFAELLCVREFLSKQFWSHVCILRKKILPSDPVVRKSKLSRTLDPLKVLEARKRLFSFWYKQIEKGPLECFLWKCGPIQLFSCGICGIWWSELSQAVALLVITYASKVPFWYIWKYPQLWCKIDFLTVLNVRIVTLFKFISALQNTWK